jgi:hypothetical protein
MIGVPYLIHRIGTEYFVADFLPQRFSASLYKSVARLRGGFIGQSSKHQMDHSLHFARTFVDPPGISNTFLEFNAVSHSRMEPSVSRSSSQRYGRAVERLGQRSTVNGYAIPQNFGGNAVLVRMLHNLAWANADSWGVLVLKILTRFLPKILARD